jgi:amino acid adenylation domain-containing protein
VPDTHTVTYRPATAEQRRVLAQQALVPCQAEEIALAYRIGGVPLDRIVEVLTKLVDSRDMLRARLVVTETGEALQEIHDRCAGVDVVPVDDDLDTAISRSRAEPLTDRPVWFQAVVYPCSTGECGVLLRMHHGLVDGYSVALIERQLWALLSRADDPPRPRYADIAEPADLDEAARWWDVKLAGATPVTVPADPTGEPAMSAAALPIELSREQSDAVRALAGEYRTTPFAVLLTAHMLTIAIYSGQQDIVVATPYLNRERPQADDLVGPLVNLLPIRARLHGSRLRDNLAGVAAELRAALAHADVPFDRIVANAPRASDGGFGVVRTSSVLNPPPVPVADGPFHVERIVLPTVSLRWDLVTTLRETDGGYRGTLLYRTDRYPASTMESVRDCFLRVLTEKPPRVETVPARPATNGRHSLSRLLDLADFAADDPVVVLDGTPTSRATFTKLVAGYAAELARWGPKPVVGLGLRSPVHQAAALLAVWRSAGAALLLDPQHPQGRRKTILRDAAPACVLSDPVDKAASLPARVQPHPHDLAYLVYTSGTDGAPKGVAASYANLDHLLAMLRELRVRAAGQNPLGQGFDGWLWATLLPWISGRPAVFGSRGVADVTAMVGGQPSSVTATPTMLAELAPDTAPATVVSAGEELAPALARRLLPGRRVINAYGPTELTVCATWADSAANEDVTSIGRPVPGMTVYLLDADLAPVPRGAIGEMFVAGPGVTLGYHGRPAQTASHYLPDPFAADGSRMYRTGDLARIGPDGLLRYAGRRDTQTKVSGVRVELGEVVAVAMTCDGVRDATAIVHTDGGAAEIRLAVVPDDPSADQAELIAHVTRLCCANLLPEMRPMRIVTVAELPRTANGKLDQPALRGLLAGDAAPQPADLGLRARIAAVWRAVLNVDIDNYDRTFFSYGGHSLAAARTVARLRRELDVPIPVVAFFDHPTVNAFAAWLEAGV